MSVFYIQNIQEEEFNLEHNTHTEKQTNEKVNKRGSRLKLFVRILK